MFKPILKNILGNLGLLVLTDHSRMAYQKIINYRKNRKFRKNHPHFKLPEDSILYETFKLDYSKYYQSGSDTAHWLIEHYNSCSNRALNSILDWGCGPGRVVRHFPGLVPQKCKIYGTDFNTDTIKWCQSHIPQVQFIKNELDPPIKIASSSVSYIYAISVFTHLSTDRHRSWLVELHRILEPAGVLLFTTQGYPFINRLTAKEKILFEQGKPIVRDNHKEGRRIFSTFHPPNYIKSILKDHYKIIEHQSKLDSDDNPEQDIWIVEKK